MKTLALFLLTLPLFSLPAQPFPAEGIGFSSKVIEQKALAIQLTDLDNKRTAISLQNNMGDFLYRESIKEHEGFRTKLDLSQLPLGRYTLTVSQKGEKKSQLLLIGKDKVLISKVVNRE